MKIQLTIAVLILSFAYNAYADDLSNRISTGMNKSEVAFILGGSPDSEDCTTTLGVQKCNLIWKKGIVSRTIYTVTTIADKVISVNTQSAKLFGN